MMIKDKRGEGRERPPRLLSKWIIKPPAEAGKGLWVDFYLVSLYNAIFCTCQCLGFLACRVVCVCVCVSVCLCFFSLLSSSLLVCFAPVGVCVCVYLIRGLLRPIGT